MRYFLTIIIIAMVGISANAQKWLPGHFTDAKGNKEAGFIRVNPAARGPMPDEGFIEFREDSKANSFNLSASEIQSFVIGRDSFVVAHAPQGEMWAKKEFDFVKVALNEDIKLYAARGGSGGGGHGVVFEPEIGVGAGVGTGGYGSGVGAGVGGGIGIPIGGGGGGEERGKTTWYYGENTAGMKSLNDLNFEDVMTDVMGDEPDVVDKIHAKVYVLANIDRLIAYFKQVQAGHK
jgi:hypothetical protein